MKKKAVIRIISIFLIIGIILISIIIPSFAAERGNITADSDNIYFSSAVPSAPPGSTIMNCLGYFITVKTNKTVDTVFVHGKSLTGRAYYTGYSDKTKICIPVSDVISAFNAEYGNQQAKIVKSIFNKKITGACTINTLMCTAKLKGNSIQSQNGWNQVLKTDNAAYTEIAYTQVKLKKSSITAKDIESDLFILNKNPTYTATLDQNNNLKCLVINPNNNLTSGGAVISVTNGSDDFSKYNNLNSDSVFGSFNSKQIIKYSYYNLNVNFTGKKQIKKNFTSGKVGAVNYTINQTNSKAQPKTITYKRSNDTIIYGIIGAGLLAAIALFAYFVGKQRENNV